MSLINAVHRSAMGARLMN